MLSTLRKSDSGMPGASSAVPHFAVPAAAESAATSAAIWRTLDLDAPLEGTEIDIWILPTRCMGAFARTRRHLSETEFAHIRALRRDDMRVRYTAVRSLLRQALAHRLETDGCTDWHLHTNRFGKPELSGDIDSVGFNITHAGAFSAVAVTSQATIGIDAEKVEGARLQHLPFDCFTAREQAHLQGLSEARRPIDFFKLWTLKEAYAKALGLGFSAEFNRIEFGLDPISLDRKSPKAPSGTHESFSLLSLDFDGASYFLALCLLNAARPAAPFKPNLFVIGS